MPDNKPKCSALEKEILDIENEIKKLQNELFENLSAEKKAEIMRKNVNLCDVEIMRKNVNLGTGKNAEITRKIDSLRTELRVLKAELISCKP